MKISKADHEAAKAVCDEYVAELDTLGREVLTGDMSAVYRAFMEGLKRGREIPPLASGQVVTEHWTSEDGSVSTFLPADTTGDRVVLLRETPVYCCETVGSSWEDCLRQYHEHMGWEKYQPMSKNEPGEDE